MSDLISRIFKLSNIGRRNLRKVEKYTKDEIVASGFFKTKKKDFPLICCACSSIVDASMGKQYDDIFLCNECNVFHRAMYNEKEFQEFLDTL